MPVAEPKVYQSAKLFLERQGLDFQEVEEQYCTQLKVQSGAVQGSLSVYNTGRVAVGGKQSPLKVMLTQFKDAIENGGALPGQALPFEIDKFPETILERVPDCAR